MNSSSFTLVLALVLMAQPLRSEPAYKNKHEPIDRRSADLVGRMTLEEKILQLQEKKRDLVKNLITAETSFFKSLTRDDVKMLFE